MFSCIAVITRQMESLDNFFGLELSCKVVSMADNLSKMLRRSTVSVSKEQNVMNLHYFAKKKI